MSQLIQRKWSGRLDSNQQPHAPKARALPIALHPDLRKAPEDTEGPRQPSSRFGWLDLTDFRHLGHGLDALSSGAKALILIESNLEIIKTPNAQRWHKAPKDGPLI